MDSREIRKKISHEASTHELGNINTVEPDIEAKMVQEFMERRPNIVESINEWANRMRDSVQSAAEAVAKNFDRSWVRHQQTQVQGFEVVNGVGVLTLGDSDSHESKRPEAPAAQGQRLDMTPGQRARIEANLPPLSWDNYPWRGQEDRIDTIERVDTDRNIVSGTITAGEIRANSIRVNFTTPRLGEDLNPRVLTIDELHQRDLTRQHQLFNQVGTITREQFLRQLHRGA